MQPYYHIRRRGGRDTEDLTGIWAGAVLPVKLLKNFTVIRSHVHVTSLPLKGFCLRCPLTNIDLHSKWTNIDFIVSYKPANITVLVALFSYHNASYYFLTSALFLPSFLGNDCLQKSFSFFQTALQSSDRQTDRQTDRQGDKETERKRPRQRDRDT